MGLRGHHRSTTATEQTASFLVVRFGKNYFALPSQGVRGVLTRKEAGREQTVTAVGVTYRDVNLADRLSTVLDLTHPDIRTVLYSNGLSHGAFRVEEVIGMIDVEKGQCKPLPPHFQQEERTWISGTLFFREHLALILNPEWVMGKLGEEMSVIAESARSKAGAGSTAHGGQC
ncbi:chemotaxis protein CheW [Petrachloros mirabilis]